MLIKKSKKTSKNVTDHIYEFEIGEEETEKINTDRISGKLVMLLVSSDKLYYNFNLSMRDMPIQIFKHLNVDRSDWIAPIKTDYFNVSIERHEAPDFWVLNDELVIKTEGLKGTKIKCTLRVLNG